MSAIKVRHAHLAVIFHRGSTTYRGLAPVAPPSRRLNAAPGRAFALRATAPAGQRWPPGRRRYRYTAPQPPAAGTAALQGGPRFLAELFIAPGLTPRPSHGMLSLDLSFGPLERNGAQYHGCASLALFITRRLSISSVTTNRARIIAGGHTTIST
ncbi:MAG TPA: hypothetical protein VH599_15500 [Ktedonobacterales bacterium]